MARLKNKLALENVVEDIDELSSLKELREYSCEIFKNLIDFEQISFLIEKMDNYFLVGSEYEYLNISSKDQLILNIKERKSGFIQNLNSSNEELNKFAQNKKLL